MSNRVYEDRIHNYFVVTTQSGGKDMHTTVIRAPLGHTWQDDSAEKYLGRGKWALNTHVDERGSRYTTPGGKKFPPDGKAANAFMRRSASRGRSK